MQVDKQVDKSEPSFGELLGAMARSTASLVTQEVKLASTEMGAKASTAATAVGHVALGGVVLHLGLLVLAISAIVGLSEWIPVWLSALVLGTAVSAAGAVFLVRGLGTLKGLSPVPHATLETLRDDVAWAKEHVQ